MPTDGGSPMQHQQQLPPSKQKQPDYNASVVPIRKLNGRLSVNSSSTELKDGPDIAPFSNVPLQRCGLDFNAPLLSTRRLNGRHPGNSSSTASRDNPGPSPFYKLSAELSRESLRIPGAVPFVWELAPGRRKVSHDSNDADIIVSQPCSDIAYAIDSQPHLPKNKQSLRSLFHQGSSIDTASSGRPPSLAVASSKTCFSQAPHVDDYGDDDDSSDTAFTTATDAFTTACGLSSDDFEGSNSLAQTGSDARTFIMHRFLPAAHAIAYDSPQTPSRRPPAVYLPSPFFHSRLRRFSPLHPALAVSLASPIRPPPSPLLYGDTHHKDLAAFKGCGMFSYRFLNAFLNLHRDSCWPKQQKKSKAPSRPATLGDILCQDESSDDDQDGVARQVRMNEVKKRAHKMLKHVRPSVASKGSTLYQLLQFEEAEMPNDSIRRSVIFNREKNGATMSVFLEGKGCIGLPKERHLNDVSSETDGSITCFETPRGSMSDSKMAEMDTCNNDYGSSSSSRISSFFSRVHRPASPGQRDAGTELPSPHSRMGTISPGNARTPDSNCSPGAPDSALQQPNNRKRCEILAPEKNPWHLLASSRRPSSPSRFFGAKTLPESPPLPKSPSDSWLWKAIPLKVSKLSPLSLSRTTAKLPSP